MLVMVFDMDNGTILDAKRLTPRKAHRYMLWLKENMPGVYWTCTPSE